MQLIVNGESRVTTEETVAAYLLSLGIQQRLVVIERNGEIIPRDLYAQTPLQEGDALEIVQMMAGG